MCQEKLHLGGLAHGDGSEKVLHFAEYKCRNHYQIASKFTDLQTPEASLGNTRQ